MFVLNVICTVMAGYYNRNGKVREYLEKYSETFEEGQTIIEKLDQVGRFIDSMDLPRTSMWWNKANFFTMTIQFADHLEILVNPKDISTKLIDFEAAIPNSYSLAAREAVNTKANRLVRAQHFNKVLGLPELT